MLLIKSKGALLNPDITTPTLSAVGLPPLVDLDIRKQGLVIGNVIESLTAAGIGTATERTFNVLSGTTGKSKPTCVFDNDLNAPVLEFNGNQNIKTSVFNRPSGVPLTLAILAKTDHIGASRVLTAGVSVSTRKAIQTSTIGYTILVGNNAVAGAGHKPAGWSVLIAHFNNAGSKLLFGKAIHNTTYADLDTAFDTLNIGSAGDGNNGFIGRIAYIGATVGKLTDDDLHAMYDEILTKFELA